MAGRSRNRVGFVSLEKEGDRNKLDGFSGFWSTSGWIRSLGGHSAWAHEVLNLSGAVPGLGVST